MIAARAQDIVMEFPSGAGKLRVLHGVSLDVPFGEMTMIVGPSGCGKTTVLSILSGTLTPSGGDVFLLNENLTRMSDQGRVKLRRRQIGFIFQQYNLIPTLTAAENASIPLLADGVSMIIAQRKAEVLFEKLGLAGQANKYPRQLSGGQQQRVAIARALIHEPALIVCDEPTSALDAMSGQAAMTLLEAAAKDSARAVVVVTHDDRIHHFADRVIAMEDGRILTSSRSNQRGESP